MHCTTPARKDICVDNLALGSAHVQQLSVGNLARGAQAFQWPPVTFRVSLKVLTLASLVYLIQPQATSLLLSSTCFFAPATMSLFIPKVLQAMWPHSLCVFYDLFQRQLPAGSPVQMHPSKLAFPDPYLKKSPSSTLLC